MFLSFSLVIVIFTKDTHSTHDFIVMCNGLTLSLLGYIHQLETNQITAVKRAIYDSEKGLGKQLGTSTSPSVS